MGKFKLRGCVEYLGVRKLRLIALNYSTPIENAYTTSYLSPPIVTMVLSCTV